MYKISGTMLLAIARILILIPFVDSCLLINILKHKNIKHLVNFECNKIEDRITNQRFLINNGIRSSNMKTEQDTLFIDKPSSFPKVGLVLNTSCDRWTSNLESLDHSVVFKHPYSWLIFTDNLTETENVLSEYPIEVDSDVLIIHQIEVRYFQLYEAYNTGFYTEGQFIVESIGHWNNSKLEIEERRRVNMTGVVLKCMVVVTHKLVNETLHSYLEKSRPTSFDLLHKSKFYTLLKYLRDIYNFSYDLKRTKSWGYSTNGSFDGMIGAVQRREIDIGGSPVFFRAERFKVLDYSSETWRSKQCFIFRHPKRLGAFYTIFTRPLSKTVWYSTLAVLTLSTMILCMLLKLKILREKGDDEDSSVSIAFLSIWSAVCQQGMAVQRSANSVKLVLLCTFVFTLTLYQYYNATVVSTLLREPPKNIRSLEDLLRSDLKTGVEDVLYNHDFFRRTTNPIAKNIYNEKIVTSNQRNFFDAEKGMALVKKGGFAFHVDSSSGYRIMKRIFNERETCEVQEVELFPPQNMVSVLTKGSPFKGIIAYGLRKMMESGLMHRIKSVWDEPKPDCVRTPDTSVFSVSIVEFSTPLLILVFGVLTSIAVLLCEIGVCRMQKVIQFRHKKPLGRAIGVKWMQKAIPLRN